MRLMGVKTGMNNTCFGVAGIFSLAEGGGACYND